MTSSNHINFDEVRQHVRGYEEVLMCRLLPHAKKQGNDWVALNPTRLDRHLGSFRINATTCRWIDHATGDKGGDIISLWAYIRQISQLQAAREILTILGKD
jgi:hypothetical protein